MDADIYVLAERLGDYLRTQSKRLVTAESCTGGWVAKALTDVPGSSHWFDRGFVTYSNAAKAELLGVDQALLDQYGAVSAETVTAMAQGALRYGHGHIALAVSGIAGPDGGSTAKPVGTVWFAWMSVVPDSLATYTECFVGNRETIRRAAVLSALRNLIQFVAGADK